MMWHTAKNVLQHPQGNLVVTLLLVGGLSWTVAWLPWIEYGDFNSAGRRSTKVFGCFLSALGLFSLYSPSLISRGVYWLAVLASLIIIALGWLYFDFYMTYLDFSAYSLLSEAASDGSKSLLHLQSLPSLLWCFVPLILLLILMFMPKQELGRWQKAIVLFLIIVCLGFAYIQTEKRKHKNTEIERYVSSGNHPITYFLTSAIASPYAEVTNSHLNAFKYFGLNVGDRDFPLVGDHISARKRNYKNIIIIVLESVRAAETSALMPEFSVTPNLDDIAANHFFAKNSLANATQTIRGELSILCSVLDNSASSPVSNQRPRLKSADCIPDILRKYDYESLWFHGNSSDFFSRTSFHPSMGFAELYDRDRILSESGEPEDLIGWGLSDQQVFSFAFEKLLQLQQQGQRFFAEIMTLSNHYPFDWSWPDDINSMTFDDIDSGQIYKNYLRGVAYTDQQLGLFWQKFMNSSLKDDTIVVITGDHGIWLFHEEQVNQKGVYFRSPLVIYMPGEVLPAVSKVTSQVDIPPTLLDLLGISGEFSFFGKSIFSNNKGFALANQFGMPSLVTDEYACTLDSVKYGRYGTKIDSGSKTEASFVCAGLKLSEDGRLTIAPTANPPVLKDEILLQANQLISYFDIGHLIGFKAEDSTDRAK